MRRIVVTPTLQTAEHPEVFAIGDAAHFEQDGRPLPMIAPVANQQARSVAENITRLVQGKELKKFIYKDPGILATIGRNAAVAKMGDWGV